MAQRALERGDLVSAQRYAVHLPASPSRDELLARIAGARGQSQLALEYSLAAFDSDAVEAASQRLAVTDPQAAYELERLLEVRLSGRAMPPDAVAEARLKPHCGNGVVSPIHGRVSALARLFSQPLAFMP